MPQLDLAKLKKSSSGTAHPNVPAANESSPVPHKEGTIPTNIDIYTKSNEDNRVKRLKSHNRGRSNRKKSNEDTAASKRKSNSKTNVGKTMKIPQSISGSLKNTQKPGTATCKNIEMMCSTDEQKHRRKGASRSKSKSKSRSRSKSLTKSGSRARKQNSKIRRQISQSTPFDQNPQALNMANQKCQEE